MNVVNVLPVERFMGVDADVFSWVIAECVIGLKVRRIGVAYSRFSGALRCKASEIGFGAGQSEHDDCQIPGNRFPDAPKTPYAHQEKEAIKKKDNHKSVVATMK